MICAHLNSVCRKTCFQQHSADNISNNDSYWIQISSIYMYFATQGIYQTIEDGLFTFASTKFPHNMILLCMDILLWQLSLDASLKFYFLWLYAKCPYPLIKFLYCSWVKFMHGCDLHMSGFLFGTGLRGLLCGMYCLHTCSCSTDALAMWVNQSPG